MSKKLSIIVDFFKVMFVSQTWKFVCVALNLNTKKISLRHEKLYD